MQTAQVEVRRLLDQIRVLSPNSVIQRASDQIEVLCSAYMEPDQSPAGLALGLRGNESAMFELLHKRMGHTVSKFALFDAGKHGPDSETEIKTLQVQMCRLRQQLIGTKYEGSIQTVWGIGYRMKPVAELEAKAA